MRTAFVALFFLACGEGQSFDNPEDQAIPRPTSFDDPSLPGTVTEALTPAQVIGVISVGETAIFEQARMAQRMAVNPVVRNFADRTLALNDPVQHIRAIALSQLGLTPTGSPVSDRLQQRVVQLATDLQVQGVGFDEAFLAAQIEVQREVIRAVDQSGICGGTAFRSSPCVGLASSRFTDPVDTTRFDNAFDDTSLITGIRSAMISDLTDAFIIRQLITPIATPIP